MKQGCNFKLRASTVVPFVLVLAAGAARAQGPNSLRTVQAPLPSNLDDFVKDRAAAIRLGKALFWDEQTGGDGRIACATCHFASGGDPRTVNTIHPGPDGQFDGVPGPGGTLTVADFPIAGDNIVGSQGIVGATFVGLDPNDPIGADQCTPADDGVFFPNRRVTGRNAPNFIMSIFNRDNFWDGRAKRDFNGVNPAGNLDPAPVVFVGTNRLRAQAVTISAASLASQTVGPPNNPVEMSCDGRSFPILGRKLLGRTPLGNQRVAPSDSVLGSLSLSPANGISRSYAQLIRAAFRPNLHASPNLTPDGFTQMEANFSLFWGLSILMYNSTLKPDRSPFDRFKDGNANALSGSQLAGLNVFLDKGRCIQCHSGPEFTAAPSGGSRSFANTGVTPTAADGGRQPDNLGEFKTPTLRNVELTGPYFHNGRYLSLMQVVDFYNRGGDVANAELDDNIRPLGLTASERTSLVDFMLALTDDRVRFERAPFDHPSLNAPNGTAIAAVGAAGRATAIRPFLDANHFAP